MASAKPGLLVVVAGPTAVGKTQTAIELALHYNTCVLSADSRQFYRELSIGTAKPGPDELQQVPHYFINTLSIAEDYSAGDFERDALQLLQNFFEQHRVVILCGGSGLFIRALCEGLDNLPLKDEELRKALAQQLETSGLQSLQKELQQLDPEYAATVDLQNPNRVMRALEVCRLSGKKYSELRLKQLAPRPFRVLYIGLDLPRETLYQRINARVDEMMQKGLVEEAKAVLPWRQKAALKTVGYAELFEYFDGNMSLATATDKIKQHSRNYAKKQLTWFRKIENMHWFAPGQTAEMIACIDATVSDVTI